MTTRSTSDSRDSRRFTARLAAVAGVAALCAAFVPATSASAAGSVMLQNGGFTDSVLCASASNQSVWVLSKAAAKGNKYCQWKQFGPDYQFTLYNVGKDQVAAFNGGNVEPVVMEDEGSNSNANAQLWSWGGLENWEASALQSYLDSGQNVDALSPNGESPRTDPVRTRGWRHGHQRELTWTKVTPV
jgi:hypothetical protein